MKIRINLGAVAPVTMTRNQNEFGTDTISWDGLAESSAEFEATPAEILGLLKEIGNDTRISDVISVIKGNTNITYKTEVSDTGVKTLKPVKEEEKPLEPNPPVVKPKDPVLVKWNEIKAELPAAGFVLTDTPGQWEWTHTGPIAKKTVSANKKKYPGRIQKSITTGDDEYECETESITLGSEKLAARISLAHNGINLKVTIGDLREYEIDIRDYNDFVPSSFNIHPVLLQDTMAQAGYPKEVVAICNKYFGIKE